MDLLCGYLEYGMLVWLCWRSSVHVEPDANRGCIPKFGYLCLQHEEDGFQRLLTTETWMFWWNTNSFEMMELDGIHEFATVVGYLNHIFVEGEWLHFIHWDFQKFAKRKKKLYWQLRLEKCCSICLWLRYLRSSIILLEPVRYSQGLIHTAV